MNSEKNYIRKLTQNLFQILDLTDANAHTYVNLKIIVKITTFS